MGRRRYQQGEYARVPLAWNDRTGTLTIGAREGNYPGMPQAQRFVVRLISPDEGGNPLAESAPNDRTVDYSGTALQIHLGA